jgi:hypothetical protein
VCCSLTSLAIWSSAWSSADTLVFPRRLPFAPGLSIFAFRFFLLLITGPHNVLYSNFFCYHSCKQLLNHWLDYGGQRAINFFLYKRWYDHKNYVNFFAHSRLSPSTIIYMALSKFGETRRLLWIIYTLYTDDYYKNMYTHSQLIFLFTLSLFCLLSDVKLKISPSYTSGWSFLSRAREKVLELPH